MPHTTDLAGARRIWLIGIGGTAMAPLAGMLKERGYVVSGSDKAVYPPMSTYLEQLGIEVLEGYTKEHLETFRPDLVVIGNAAARTNTEVEATLELDLPYTSMPEAIYQLFMKDRYSIVIAGTHGKTTTTSLMAWLLESAGLDPSFVVGGVPVNFGSNFKLGSGKPFVIEGDEYNTAFFDKGPKFLHYHANALLVNNIEFDHADIYDSLEQIVGAFRQAVEQVAPDDVIVANGDDEVVQGLRASARARWVRFGFGADCEARVSDVRYTPEGAEFTAWWEGKEWGRFRSPLSGPHNVLNALADSAIARLQGVSNEQIQRGLESFRGIRRRMEVRGVERGVTVIDDFAHHPTAVETTLKGARDRYPGSTIWALFEPRSISSSRKEFEEGYARAFTEADRVVIGPVFYRERYESQYGVEKMMSIPAILDSVRRSGRKADHIDSFDAMVEKVRDEAGEGDVVLVMSSGAFGGIHEKLLDALRGE